MNGYNPKLKHIITRTTNKQKNEMKLGIDSHQQTLDCICDDRKSFISPLKCISVSRLKKCRIVAAIAHFRRSSPSY